MRPIDASPGPAPLCSCLCFPVPSKTTRGCALEATVQERCSAEGCVETAAVAMDERRFCRAHFLAYSYRSLEATAAQFQQPQFHELHADAASRFLEECMRQAAEIACAPVVPGNFERAQVLDVLLWASELYGHLRRGP